MPDYESGFRQVPSDPSIGIFAGENLPTCPFCRSEIPAWTTRETYGLTTRVLFRCGQCAAVFSVTAADIMGRSDSIMSVAGLIKALHGKRRNHSYYARVEVPGNCREAAACQGREYAMETLYTLRALNFSLPENASLFGRIK
ncbi:hypothetical protein [Oscillibacter ruminantium]|uniref:hypothetical protein n=1 Tax=Oscillibacter ruminantium TaxID=1263547 RepID=UPI00058CD0F0|nr:hypothetical protein [Oscillibacter ruminantium]